MIVTEDNFHETLDKLEKEKTLSLDTETTSLNSFRGGSLFSIIMATSETEYYFNFNEWNQSDVSQKEPILGRKRLNYFQKLFNDKERLWIGGNFKFDLAFLAKEGLFIHGKIYDVLVMARIERNDHLKYSLAACAERIKLEKSKEVEEWIKKNKAYKKEIIPGKKGVRNNPQFWMVPLPIVSKYGCMDARITYDLYIHQMNFFKEWDEKHLDENKSIMPVVHNEMALTKVCFDIERRGILLDREYVEKALAREQNIMKECEEEFLSRARQKLVDSNKALKEAFNGTGITAATTEKGNVSFTEEVLSRSDHPLAVCLLRYRDANKRASSYFSSFLYHADCNNIVHCNIRQSATTTGRFSISDPALQTLNAEDESDSEWKVRRSFRPREGFVFVDFDFKAFEFRAMLDTAREVELATQIENGLDPHQATADLVGITRKQAKTLNFGLLYGMGAQKLSDALNVPLAEGRRIKAQYFSKLPKIRDLIYRCQGVAQHRQHVVNRFGRPYQFPESKFAYKALNAIIQGGTADAIKFAMVEIHEFLKDKLSKMVLQVHDSLLFEISKEEFWIIPHVKAIMEKSWPENFHKMECSVEWSERSWGNMREHEGIWQVNQRQFFVNAWWIN